MSETKRCARCKEDKLQGDFYQHNASNDGIGCWCIKCSKENAYWNGAVAYSKVLNPKSIEEWCRMAAKYAVSCGVAKRQESCAACGRSRKSLIPSHADPKRPLEMIWLCADCYHLVRKDAK